MFLVVGVGCWEVFYFTLGGVFWFGLVFKFFVVLLAWDFLGDGGAIALVKNTYHKNSNITFGQ